MAWHRRPAPGNWATLKAQVMVAHSGICWVCGHGQADQCDHIINVARGGTHDLDNLQPIHGTPFGTNPCPVCGRHCHQEKTKQEQAAGRAGSRGRADTQAGRHTGIGTGQDRHKAGHLRQGRQ